MATNTGTNHNQRCSINHLIMYIRAYVRMYIRMYVCAHTNDPVDSLGLWLMCIVHSHQPQSTLQHQSLDHVHVYIRMYVCMYVNTPMIQWIAQGCG